MQVHHGHHSPTFTAKSYIHLKPEELPPVDGLEALVEIEPVGADEPPEELVSASAGGREPSPVSTGRTAEPRLRLGSGN